MIKLLKNLDKVVGESRRKEEYPCFAENYCGCYSFFYDVVNKGEQLCVRLFIMLLLNHCFNQSNCLIFRSVIYFRYSF